MISSALPHKLLLIILLSLSGTSVFAQQGIPVIQRYSVENYQAGTENWDAIQDDKGLMYFANSEGLLEFDGVNWRLIQTKNRTKIRSLGKSEKGIIYVGGDTELGYLENDKSGQKKYTSLLNRCPPEYRHYTGHVWKVVVHEGKKIFLANGSVLIFDEQDHFLKILKEDIYLRSLFYIDNRLYAYSNTKGLLLLDDQRLEFSSFYKDPFVLNRSIEFVSGHPKGGLRFHVFDKGFYRLHKGILSLENTAIVKPINTDYIFCQGRTKDLLLLGTTINGLYALSDQGLHIKFHLDRKLGLNDNKIFSVFTDHTNNIWICHENGLSYVELNAPIRLINENLGISGTGYCSIVFDSTLFVGTSHGLFSSKLGTDNSFYNFSLFKLIRQPIYFMEKRGKSLLIGCLLELFEYDGKNLKVLHKSRNNNNIVPFPHHPDYYLTSHNDGFLLLKYENGFQVVKAVEGIDAEVLDFEVDSDGTIWIINSTHELILAGLNSEMDSFHILKGIKKNLFTGLKFLTISTYNQHVVLGTDKGLFSFDRERKKLAPLPSADKDTSDYVVNWLYNQNNEDLWYEKTYYTNGQLHYKIDILSDRNVHYQVNSLNSEIYGNKAFSFGKFNSSELVIGTSEGFLLFNTNFNDERLNEVETYIRKIRVSDANDTTNLEGLWMRGNNQYELPLNQEVTYIELDCASNYFYSQDKVMYSYKMDGTDDRWSDWSRQNKIRYALNGDGEFTFHVRVTSNFSNIGNITSYRFIIKKPWYKTLWWYSIEMGILLVVMALSVYFNRKGSTKISKVSAIVLVLMILTIFEIFSEILQDWMDAQGLTIFALRIIINILIALSINPVESWLRKKLIRRIPQKAPADSEDWI